jgi:prophage tail gpP-like protein
MILKINDRIRNRKVEFFNQFKINLQYDSIASGVSFSAYFNPDNQEHVDLYCIGHYHLATVEHNGELLFTGYVLGENFNDESKRQLVSFNGYSLPGVLEDCEIPPSLYPLESNGLSLREIAQKYLAPFGIKFQVDPAVAGEMNKVYEKVTASEIQTIKSFLTELAAQRNIIISHNEAGSVLFTRARTKQKPILNYGEEGGPPFTSMSLDFSGQGMHSHIYVIKQADADGGNAGETVIRNPYVPFVYRPKVLMQSAGDDNDTEHAARLALSAELKNLKLTIVTDRWEIDGKITVVNPRVYLFKKSTWFIESIELKGNEEKTVATLTCVLPEVYNNEIPKYLFEGINLH